MKYVFTILIGLLFYVFAFNFDSVLLKSFIFLGSLVVIIIFIIADIFNFLENKLKKSKKPTKEDFDYLDQYSNLLNATGLSQKEKDEALREMARGRGINLK